MYIMNIILLLILLGILTVALGGLHPMKQPLLKNALNKANTSMNQAKYPMNKAKPSMNKTMNLMNKANSSMNNKKGNNSGNVLQEFQGLPYPQISRDVQRLSVGKSPEPIDMSETPPPAEFIQYRTIDSPDNMTVTRKYVADYYRKDTMPENNIGTTEYSPAYVEGNNTPWSDESFSEHPSFYNPNNLKDEITNIGAFFDENNQYHDTTSSNTFALPSDTCYTDSEGGETCINNSRLQMVPPVLIHGAEKNQALVSIGKYQEIKGLEKKPESVSGGGAFYGTIYGSQPLGMNETFAAPLGQQMTTLNENHHYVQKASNSSTAPM